MSTTWSKIGWNILQSVSACGPERLGQTDIVGQMKFFWHFFVFLESETKKCQNY